MKLFIKIMTMMIIAATTGCHKSAKSASPKVATYDWGSYSWQAGEQSPKKIEYQLSRVKIGEANPYLHVRMNLTKDGICKAYIFDIQQPAPSFKDRWDMRWSIVRPPAMEASGCEKIDSDPLLISDKRMLDVTSGRDFDLKMDYQYLINDSSWAEKIPLSVNLGTRSLLFLSHGSHIRTKLPVGALFDINSEDFKGLIIRESWLVDLVSEASFRPEKGVDVFLASAITDETDTEFRKMRHCLWPLISQLNIKTDDELFAKALVEFNKNKGKCDE